MYAKRNCKYFTMQFCHFPICFLLQICIDILYNHFLHVIISFCSGKPRTAHGIQEKGGGMWMWLTITCKWYGWVIALLCMALLYLPSHFNKLHRPFSADNSRRLKTVGQCLTYCSVNSSWTADLCYFMLFVQDVCVQGWREVVAICISTPHFLSLS